MTVINKWTQKTYKVIEIKEKSVILERENGEQFEIAKSEFNFNYRGEK